LALISTGDRFAVASRGDFSTAGHWVWHWKNHIDQRFMRQFSALQPMPQAVHPADNTPIKLEADEEAEVVSVKAMRCGGCGAKMGADILSRVLRQLQPSSSPDVLLGLADADDAAVVRVPAGHHLVHTVDFFRAMLDDPYLFGKIAANHALGDLWAMGAQPHTCTAIVTLPPGLQRKTEAQLLDMMRGAIEVLNSAGCALVGGHTGEGKELALGFALQGLIRADAPTLLRKNGLQAGNVLLLTKPLGTGTLLAALPQCLAQGRWIDAALQTMLQSSQQAAHIAQAHGATACTDVTGFGLMGHLLEMAHSAQRDAAINLDALPLLPGAQACIARRIVSSLHASNQRAEHSIYNRSAYQQHPHYGILFDPQTAGGLLLSIPAEQAIACLYQLQQAGYAQAAMIGRVLDSHHTLQPIHLHSNSSTMNHP
jgi:selenide, water dikinase